MTSRKIGAGRKPAPLTSQQKQSIRRAALDEIARAAGWKSWDQYATAVKRGAVKIAGFPTALPE